MKRIAWRRIGLLALVLVVCLAAGYVAFTMRSTGDVSGERYATIGPEEVTLREIERAYADRADTHESLTMREYFEDIYAPRTLLLLEAHARDITVSEAEIDEWIDTINSTAQSRNSTFEQRLEELGVSHDELRSDIHDTILLDRFLEIAVAREVNVTAAEVEAAYEEAGYESLGIPLEQARDEIGPQLLREKRDERLRTVIEELNGRYDVTIV